MVSLSRFMLVNESRQGRARARIGQGLGPQGTGRVAGRGGGARGGGRQAQKASGSPPRTGPFLEGVQGEGLGLLRGEPASVAGR